MFNTFLFQQIDFGRLSGLSLQFARGILTVEIPIADIDYAALQIARAAAGARGVEVESIQVTLEPDSRTSLKFHARVTARKVLFRAHVCITGRLLVNDVLEAVLTDLKAVGEGIMGDLAALAVQPELEKYENRAFPLTLPPNSPLHLREVHLEAGPPLRILAAVHQFRSA